METKVKKNKGNYTFDLSFKGLTSEMADEILMFLQMSFKNAGLPELLVDFPPTENEAG